MQNIIFSSSKVFLISLATVSLYRSLTFKIYLESRLYICTQIRDHRDRRMCRCYMVLQHSDLRLTYNWGLCSLHDIYIRKLQYRRRRPCHRDRLRLYNRQCLRRIPWIIIIKCYYLYILSYIYICTYTHIHTHISMRIDKLK